MSLSVAGVWQVGVWDQTVWSDGVWREGAPTTPTAPDSEGLEYTLKGNRAHFIFNENVTQYTIDTNRLHYSFDDEDL